MKTPAGRECNYFFGDYYRGRNREECRLLGSQWVRGLCSTCPAPGILQANACEKMKLEGEVRRPMEAFFLKRVIIKASCVKTRRKGFDPHVGCGECHPIPDIFKIQE